ncbi:MAG: DUF928 domain-containing protein [Cyanobacteria bacterium P01_D01_bin.73]
MSFRPHTRIRPIAKCLSIGALVVGQLSLSLLPSQAGFIGGVAEFGAKLKFPPTQDLGAPSRSTGGGTRGGECIAEGEAVPIQAIVPPATHNKTSDSTPEIVVYVGDTSASDIEVRMFDSGFNLVGPVDPHRISLDGRKSGLMTVSLLPEGEDNLSLEPGTYRWSVMLVCDANSSDRAGDPFDFGELEVVSLEETDQQELAGVQGLAKAELSLNKNLGYDTLAIAAGLYTSDPDAWTELISSIKFDDSAKAAITEASFLD